jgi:uncharacterized protein
MPPRIDAHVHLSRWWPELGRTAYRSDLEYTVPGLLAEMGQARIDYALAIQIVEAPATDEALDEGRRLLAESGGRLRPIGTVDPTLEPPRFQQALEALEKEPGIVGLKLFPGYRSFYPSDRRVDPVYELAHRRNLPVLVHQGDTLLGRGLLKFARPLELDEVAGRFRDVRFVLCHLGNPWIDEAAEIVYKNPNVFTDTSGLLPRPDSAYFDRVRSRTRERILDAILTTSAPERFLMGSDWPLQSLSASSALIEEADLEPEDRDAILGGNAQRLFRLGED